MDVSVIIPSFNRLWSLPQAIESCCPGTAGIEVIVVDDGSSDGTWEWLQTQNNIVAIRQQNWGKPSAANRGFRVATGKFVRFLDSDDMITSEANQRQYLLGSRLKADIVVSGYDAWYHDTGLTVRHIWTDCGDFLAQQLGECDSSHYSAYLFRREFLSDLFHRPEFAFRDDRMFVIEAAIRRPRVVAAEGVTLIHRHHQNERIQFQRGQVTVVTNWQELQMYTKVMRILDDLNMITPRILEAISNNLWPLMIRISGTSRSEGLKLKKLIYHINPQFIIPQTSFQNKLHTYLGFSFAQFIINIFRFGRNLFRY